MNTKRFIRLVVVLTGIALLFWFFSNVSHEILIGMFAGLMPSGILWHLQIRKEEKEERDWLLRNKEAFLAEIVDTLTSALHDKKNSEEKKGEIMLKRLERLQPALLIWGKPYVFYAWNDMQKNSHSTESMESKIKNGERLMRAIRKQLKHDDTSLKPGMVWATLLNTGDKQIALDACKGEVYEYKNAK